MAHFPSQELREESSPLIPKDHKDRSCLLAWGMTEHEPLSETYLAQNPTPCTLCLTHLGAACLQIAGALSGYIFLVANARSAFPLCSAPSAFDRLAGLKPSAGAGLLCEASSLCVWTFPLLCCMLVPISEFFEFCDTRLFYECLRGKMVVEFPRRRFFTAPFLLLLLGYLCLALAAVVLGGIPLDAEHADKKGDHANLVRAVLPCLVPACVFLATMWAARDLRASMLTLPSFCRDLRWAQEHLSGCVVVTEHEASIAGRFLLAETNLPPDMSSAHVFHRLRLLSERTAEKLNARSEVHSQTVPPALPGLSPLGALGAALNTSSARSAESARQERIRGDARRQAERILEDDLEEAGGSLQSGDRRSCALLFGLQGFWVVDLLWLPVDERARQFRCTFRVFGIFTWAVELLLATILFFTVLQYLHMQGRLEGAGWSRFLLPLQHAMIAA